MTLATRPTPPSLHRLVTALAVMLALGSPVFQVARGAESAATMGDDPASRAEPPAAASAPSTISATMEPPPLPKPNPPKAPPKRAAPVGVRPNWTELTPAQQEALAPLASHWDAMSEGRRRKWIALSHNFKSLSGEEQEKLHSRMSEWAGLSAQERIQARLNFAQTKKLAPEEKRAQWEAYQALSDEERKELATHAPAHPMGAAIPVKPVPAQKLAIAPPTKAVPRSTGKIETGPHHVDMHTLLPTTPPAGAFGR